MVLNLEHADKSHAIPSKRIMGKQDNGLALANRQMVHKVQWLLFALKFSLLHEVLLI